MLNDEAIEAIAWLSDQPPSSIRATIVRFEALWRELEPLLRAWVAEAEHLTEQEWLDQPESTRSFYDTWKRFFADHDKGR